ncbi:MAG: polysaccharide deacetylase family protein [Oscillospiraceae bacterium]|jgi:peptidoglycan-N-acetylmuramic acid deacetylase|nr:polysaccharide deacetylase family protein [Oscillospiraceae bacterium]
MKKFILVSVFVSMFFCLCSCNREDQGSLTDPNNENAAKTPAQEAVVDPSQENNSCKTFTGLKPLKEIKFDVLDPDNKKGLSTKGVGYGSGVGKNGAANESSIVGQEYFKSFGALALDTKSKEKVLYLTFDTGYDEGNMDTILNILNKKEVPAAFFIVITYLKTEDGRKMVARMINEGHIVGNHSTTHRDFSSLSRTQMAKEIEECDNYLRTKFGYTSPYFRFPMGKYSQSALDLVKSIGYTSVFWSVAYVDYYVNKQPSDQEAFNTITSRLHPGAVILLHSISKANVNVLSDVIDWARGQGYTFLALSDYKEWK